jgi:hypothetical protein
LKTPPVIKAKTRSIIVNLEEVPDSLTTYTFNFGDGIADLNEGNSIDNFSFTFSTGAYIDSLSAAGRVVNAATLEPEKNMLVMLYNENMDSLPYKSMPYYITKTDAAGLFYFRNLKQGDYKIFALNEKNSNYMYDSPDEIIAFSSTLVSPFVRWEADTTQNDSLPTVMKKVMGPDTLVLFAFQEDRIPQKIKKITRKDRWTTEIQFERLCPEKPVVTILKPANIPAICSYSQKNDSLTIWPSDTSFTTMGDSLVFKIDFSREDSIGNTVFMTDTVAVPPIFDKRGKPMADKVVPVFQFSTRQGAFINPGVATFFDSPWPIISFNAAALKVQEMQPDSQWIDIPSDIFKDSLNPCRLYLKLGFSPNKNYKVIALPGFIANLKSANVDTIQVSFGVLAEDVFGNLKLIVENNPSECWFELSNEKGQIIQVWAEDGPFSRTFNLLPAGKYKLIAFQDINHNRRWDTGLYIIGRQAEAKYIYEKEIPVRSNWDLEITWDMTLNSLRK